MKVVLNLQRCKKKNKEPMANACTHVFLTGIHSIIGYVLLMGNGGIQRLDENFYHCLPD